MLIIHWNIDPEIFRLGAFSLRYYSLLFALGFILSYYLLQRIFVREGIPEERLNKLSVYVITGTLLGARLGHCFFYEPGYYLSHLTEVFLPFTWVNGRFNFTGYQGLASHGGAIGILTALLLYSRKYKISLFWLLDRLAIVVALCGFLIRTGNFFNSEIIGTPSSVPWAVVFEQVDLLPRHPAQLYEAICYLLIFGSLFLLYRVKGTTLKPGLLFGILLLSVFLVRFCMEFLKEAQEAFESSMVLNMGQLLSIPFILAGIYLVAGKRPHRVAS